MISPAESRLSDGPHSTASAPSFAAADGSASHQRLGVARSPVGSRAVSPATPGAPQPQPPAGGSKNRRTAEEKRRREETELRLLIQKEMDQARVLHARILQNESQLASLAKQVDKQNEAAETERGGLQGEVRKWEKRLRQRQEAVELKRCELQEMDLRVAYLRNQKNSQRICLASFFLRNDMKPDISIDPEQIFSVTKGAGSPSPHHRHRTRVGAHEGRSLSLGGARGSEPPRAESPPPGQVDGEDGDKLRRRPMRSNSRVGAGRRTSVVVNELEVEPQLEYMRPKLHQIQHDTNRVRSAATQSVRNDLLALYSELAALEHEEHVAAAAPCAVGQHDSGEDSGSCTPPGITADGAQSTSHRQSVSAVLHRP